MPRATIPLDRREGRSPLARLRKGRNTGSNLTNCIKNGSEWAEPYCTGQASAAIARSEPTVFSETKGLKGTSGEIEHRHGVIPRNHRGDTKNPGLEREH